MSVTTVGIENRWLEFNILKAFSSVVHASFLKGEDFDLSEKESGENRLEALRLMGLERGVRLRQQHGTLLKEVKESRLDRVGWTLYDGYDGLVTRERGVALMIRHADCQAALFYDPCREAVANVHCGWRGNVGNIYLKAVEMMRHLYGTSPEDLRVCISPSLGPERGEFIRYASELPPSFWRYGSKENLFDFWKISLMQLKNAGVIEKHIAIAGVCTYSNRDLCFSYRRDRGEKRHGTLIALR
ncbi:MAG: polyphenol oxidase family protein [Simkaniaceae bacterium]|nr:polyphenol oxidase family protein [Simkaniaceae bacterium]